MEGLLVKDMMTTPSVKVASTRLNDVGRLTADQQANLEKPGGNALSPSDRNCRVDLASAFVPRFTLVSTASVEWLVDVTVKLTWITAYFGKAAHHDVPCQMFILAACN